MRHRGISLGVLALLSFCTPVRGQSVDLCSETLRVVLPPMMDRGRFARTAGPLFQRLAEQAGRTVDVNFGEDFVDAVEIFTSGRADLVLLSIRHAVAVVDTPGIHPLARTQGFRIVVFARERDSVVSLEDVRSGSLAIPKNSDVEAQALRFFSEPGEGGSGRPRWLHFTSGDDVLMSVLGGRADAGVLPEWALDWLAPTLRENLRVIGTVGSSPGGMILAGRCVSESERAAMIALLLRPEPHPDVTNFLESTKLSGFLAVGPDDLAGIRGEIRVQKRPADEAAPAMPYP